MSKTSLAVAAAVMANLIFGFSFLFTRLALAATTVPVLLMWRFLLALAALTLLAASGVQKLRLRGKNIRPLLLMGFLEPVAYFLCENYGLLYANTTFAAVAIALIPVASLLAGRLFLGERPSLAAVACCLLSVGGVVWMALLGAEAGVVRPLGVLLMALAVVSALGFNLLSRGSSGQFSPFERTFVSVAMGAVFFTLLALSGVGTDPAALLRPWRSGAFVAAVLYLGLVSSVGAYMCLHFATTFLPLARFSAFANLTTVTTMLAGALFLDEYLGWPSLLASAVILGGLWGLQKATIRQQEGATAPAAREGGSI